MYVGQKQRGITDLLGGERSPDFLAVGCIEANDRAAVAADQTIEPVAFDEWRTRPAPDRRSFESEVRAEMAGPDFFAGCGIKTQQIAHRPERKDFAIHDGRRGARPRWITDLIRAVVLMYPKRLASFRIDAKDALGAGYRVF